MIDITRLRQLALALAIAIACATNALALPPLGLTNINPAFGNLEIIDGNGYITAPGGLRVVQSTGALDFIGISHPQLSPILGVTRPVKATDGDLYVGASFRTFNNRLGTALFNLDNPSTPIVTWEGFYNSSGVGRNLTVYGNVLNVRGNFEASRFLLDGTVEPMPYPPGSDSSNNIVSLVSVTPSGFALGDGGIPGTIGSAPLLWTPNGDFDSFVFGSGSPISIRDRQDGQGLNVGNDLGRIKYGTDSPILIRDAQGFRLADSWTFVSHGDFSVLDDLEPNSVKYAYYPGINPDHPDRAVPLLDIFPELATIDMDVIHDLASVDGYLYMTLSGSDGTFLFGARDPSVVPEPATAVLMLLGGIVCAGRSRRR